MKTVERITLAEFIQKLREYPANMKVFPHEDGLRLYSKRTDCEGEHRLTVWIDAEDGCVSERRESCEDPSKGEWGPLAW